MKNKTLLSFITFVLLLSGCGSTKTTNNNSETTIAPTTSTTTTVEPEPIGEEFFFMGNRESQFAYYSASYEDDYLTLRTYVGDESYDLITYFSFNGPIGLREKTTYKHVVSCFPSSVDGLYTYNGSSYVKQGLDFVNVTFDDTTDDYSYVYEIAYEDFGLTKEEALGNFVFYPSFKFIDDEYNPTDLVDSFIRINYSETWIQVHHDNSLSYDDSFANHEVENWTKPLFVNGRETHYAFSISENTFEGAMVAAQCAERSGATNIDLHLEPLEANNQLSAENIEKICKSISIPVLALAYHGGSATQEHRLETLELAAQNGAAAVDLQGFMYWEGSTLNTQTPTNIAYWENQGYDMSFVDAHPVETVLDKEAIDKQIAFINKIHSYGSQILMSCHNQAIYTASQTLAFGKFVKDRGIDALKLVGYGKYKQDLQECVNAIKLLNDPVNGIGIPFTFHLNSDYTMQISRIICPLIYGGFMAFCYYNQTHLEMMTELNKPGKPGKDATIEEAVEYCRTHTSHSEMTSILNAYSQMRDVPNYLATAYGASSDMSDRWSVDFEHNSAHLQFRDANGTNKFSIRGYLHNLAHVGKEFAFTSSFTGKANPFMSDTRRPKVGLYLGDENNMLGFMHNTDTKTLEIMHNDNKQFNFDSSPVGDRLLKHEELLTPISGSKNPFNEEVINMGIVVTLTSIDLYYSEASNPLTKVGSVEMSVVSSLFTQNSNNDFSVGSVYEVYMGSASVGMVNYMDISNIGFYQNQKSL